MTTLCTVLARGGSKGVPNKNIRDLAGKPLIAWTLELAMASGLFQCVAVSSDSDAILDAASRCRPDLLIKRPDDLATDTTPKVPALRHAILTAEERQGQPFKTIIDLDATSPLRLLEDVQGVIRLHQDSGAKNVITGAPARRSPYFNLVELDAHGHVRLAKQPDKPFQGRQRAPRCFDMNASIYAWRRDSFMSDPRVFYDDTRLFEMPEERSIDIDTELDFVLVEHLMRRRLGLA